ncbi:MAG TPA: tetratricopeptide repeat protein [Polyangia bacterium]|nr:tetratricopeptide repeat protein [Polyangia bacterium]
MAALPAAARLLEHVAGGRYEEALGVGHDAAREELNRAHVRALFRYRNDAAAREALNRAKGLLADETQLEKARRLLRLGLREEALGHLTRSLEDAGAGLTGRERAEAHHLAGWALFQLERYREARPHLELATTLRGGAADEIWLGSTLERLGLLEPAMEHYRRAVELRGDATDCLLLGNALLGLNRWGEALPCFERSRSGGTDTPDLSEVRRHLARRRRRIRLRGTLERAVVVVRREPLDWLLAGLTLAYGAHFFCSLIQ